MVDGLIDRLLVGEIFPIGQDVSGDEVDGWRRAPGLSRQMFQISPVVTGTLTDFLTRLISSIRSSTFCSPR